MKCCGSRPPQRGGPPRARRGHRPSVPRGGEAAAAVGLAAAADASGTEPPAELPDLESARTWTISHRGGRAMVLSEKPPRAVVGVWPRRGGVPGGGGGGLVAWWA